MSVVVAFVVADANSAVSSNFSTPEWPPSFNFSAAFAVSAALVPATISDPLMKKLKLTKEELKKIRRNIEKK